MSSRQSGIRAGSKSLGATDLGSKAERPMLVSPLGSVKDETKTAGGVILDHPSPVEFGEQS